MQLKRIILTLLIAYVLVLVVNITANYELYKTGGYWQFSVPFSLCVATIGWLGYVLLYNIVFKKHLQIKKNPNVNLVLSIFISGLYGVVLMLLVMKSLVWFFHRPEQDFFNYTNNAIYAALFTMIIGLVVNGQDFLKQLKTSAEENERMKKEMLQAQYEALKNQVNPHFFFNTLSTLATLIQEEPNAAVNFIHQLSKVLRYSLNTTHDKTVSVETELKIAEAYLYICKQRFDGKLHAEISLDNEVRQKHIVPHALLTLVENCIKHNQVSAAQPLCISIFNEQGLLIVSNNYNPKKQTEPSTGIGLSNITERYKLLADMQPLVEINDNFIVKLPLLHEHTAY